MIPININVNIMMLNWYWCLMSGDSRVETDERDQLVGIVALHILHYHLFHVVDKKAFKVLWELHKKVKPCSPTLQSPLIFRIYLRFKQPFFCLGHPAEIFCCVCPASCPGLVEYIGAPLFPDSLL